MHQNHVVPLSEPALAIFDKMRDGSQGDLIFPTDYPDGVRERALAHKYKSETTAAYQRGRKLEKRRVLMKDWAQFVEGSNVIRILVELTRMGDRVG